MNHFGPHRGATFEGYYTRFTLSPGGSIVLVVCTVPHAPNRPHMLSFTYIPPEGGTIVQREIWAPEMAFNASYTSTSLQTPSNGGFTAHTLEHIAYDFTHPDVSFTAYTTVRGIPWSQTTSTPAGMLARLPLPLHWHVHSLACPAQYSLRLPAPDTSLIPSDQHGPAIAHIEKNWSRSFPRAHLWFQAYDIERGAGVCGAGGKILGVEAYIVGYRNAALGLEVDVRPPWAVRVLGLAPGLSVHREWDARRVRIVVRNWRWKMQVRASAPKGSFFGLSAPWPGGHRENFMAQSLRARIEVVVWKRMGWLGGWEEVVRDSFEQAGLEFGGEYYPFAGTERKWN